MVTTFPDEYLAATNFSGTAPVGASSEKPWSENSTELLGMQSYKVLHKQQRKVSIEVQKSTVKILRNKLFLNNNGQAMWNWRVY